MSENLSRKTGGNAIYLVEIRGQIESAKIMDEILGRSSAKKEMNNIKILLYCSYTSRHGNTYAMFYDTMLRLEHEFDNTSTNYIQ